MRGRFGGCGNVAWQPPGLAEEVEHSEGVYTGAASARLKLGELASDWLSRSDFAWRVVEVILLGAINKRK